MNEYRRQQLAAAALIDSGNYTAEQVAAVYGWIKPKHKPPERAAPERTGANRQQTGDKNALTPRRKCGIIKAIKRCIRRWKRKQEEKTMKRYEEAQNYIDAGMLKYNEILADCEEIARTDRELKESMIEQAGTIADYAAEIFAAVQELTK